MTRGFYIAVAVGGLLLALAAAGSAVASLAPPGWDRVAPAVEVVAIGLGLVVAWGGLLQARAAGDLDVRTLRRGNPTGGETAVVEVSFNCPTCGRRYRATPTMGGRPFACRGCNARFTVPTLD